MAKKFGYGVSLYIKASLNLIVFYYHPHPNPLPSRERENGLQRGWLRIKLIKVVSIIQNNFFKAVTQLQYHCS